MSFFTRLLQIAAVVVVSLLAAVLIVAAVSNWRASYRLNQNIAALRAVGAPVTLAELATKAPQPHSNAATYLGRAANGVDGIEKEVSLACAAAPATAQTEFDEGRPTPAINAVIRAAWQSRPDLMSLLQQAADCPAYDPQINRASSPQTILNSQQSRKSIRVLNYRALLMLADGDREEAFRICLVMFRLIRHFDRDPRILGHLTSRVCRSVAIDTTDQVLRSGPLPESAYTSLETELALHDLAEPLRRALATERALGLDSFRDQIAGSWLWPGSMKNDASDYLDVMAEEIGVAGEPNSASQGRATDLKDLGPLTQQLAPTVQATNRTQWPFQAEINCLRVLNALEKMELRGEVKEVAITDLGLPADAIADPFNGKVLQLKKLPAGWMIYSAGKQAQASGGTKTVALQPKPPAPTQTEPDRSDSELP